MSASSLPIIQVNPDQFDTTLAKHLKGNATVFVHITSDNDANTGKQWCPDCRKAEPKLNANFEKLQNYVVLESRLPKQGYKENPYKSHAQLQLKAIPTLYLWGANGPVKSLVEEECYDDEKLTEFFNDLNTKKQKMEVEESKNELSLPEHVWSPHIKEVLFTESVIQKKVSEMAAQISRDYHGKEILVVGLLNGAFMFVSDVLRRITCAYELDFMVVSYYGSGTTSSRNIKVKKDLSIDPAGKHVLVLEDLIDTGHTLAWIRQHIQLKNPASFKMGCLLDKKARREVEVPLDYVGMECPDEFVVGYGMDYNERYRCLPYIGVLKSSVYAKH